MVNFNLKHFLNLIPAAIISVKVMKYNNDNSLYEDDEI